MRRLILVALLISLTVAVARPADRTSINIIATSDLHGYLYPFDYYANRPANRGLAKAATIIKNLRKDDPTSMLIDCGDAIQGSPLANLFAKKWTAASDEVNPVMASMNALDYDAMVAGNHDFDFGLPLMLAARKDADFPWLAANAIVVTNADEAIELRQKNFDAAAKSVEERVLLPMIVEEVNGVNVAVIGITTPAVPSSERPENIAAYRFESAVESAREWVRFARVTRHADIVIIAAHMGLERSIPGQGISGQGIPGQEDDNKPVPGQFEGENAIYEIASKVPGIDGIIFGHTHQELAGKMINGVILAQPKFWGQSVARMTFTVERTSDVAPWKVVKAASEIVPSTSFVEPDADILKIAAPYHAAAQKYLDTPVTELKRPMDALEAVHTVQLQAAKADVSLATVFDPAMAIPAGHVTIRQMAAIYPYDNTLVAVEADGKMLRAALEYSAAHPGTSLSDAAAGADGSLKYKVDLSKPPGERVVDLTWKGAPLDPAAKLRLAINSYRKSGGGGYTMFRAAPVLWQSSEDIRQLLIAHYSDGKTAAKPQ